LRRPSKENTASAFSKTFLFVSAIAWKRDAKSVRCVQAHSILVDVLELTEQPSELHCKVVVFQNTHSGTKVIFGIGEGSLIEFCRRSGGDKFVIYSGTPEESVNEIERTGELVVEIFVAWKLLFPQATTDIAPIDVPFIGGKVI
jgi:hypothetical protein